MYVVGEIYVEVTHRRGVPAGLECAGQAGRLETQGPAAVGASSSQAVQRPNCFFLHRDCLQLNG